MDKDTKRSPETRMRILLSGLFLTYLIMNGMINRAMLIGSVIIGTALVFGWVYTWYVERLEEKMERELRAPAVSLPPTETYVFRALGTLMKMDGLEMRLRLTEQGYNVTFLANTNGVHRMVGKGSARTISEALAYAEEDLTSKKDA